MRRKIVGWTGVALATWGLAACSTIRDWTRPQQAAAVPPRPAPDAGPILAVLQMMSSLPQKDPASQAEVFQAAKDAAELTPTASNRLRYALALATPGHSGSDPVAAQRQLAEILARPETLLPAERMVAAIELKQVEQRLILRAENRRLQDEAAREEHNKLGAANRRLSTESDENTRLRKALDEARAKLEAVTHIERAINERGANGTPPP